MRRCLLAAVALFAPALAESPPAVVVHLDTLDLIPHRALARDDFRASHPPQPFLAAYGGWRPVAVSCAYLVVAPTSRMLAVPVLAATGRRYRGRIESLAFAARLSRSCSWWNLESLVSPAYVLEHEQLHFDIFEVAARRLNRDVPHLVAGLDVEAVTETEALRATQAWVQAAVDGALAQVARRNAELDRDTSFGFQPTRQTLWRRDLDRDLEELRPHAQPAVEAPATDSR